MAGTDRGLSGVLRGMGRRQRVLTTAGLVIITWVSGCAPVLGLQVVHGIASPAVGTGRPAPPARAGMPVAGTGAVTAASEVVESLPGGRQYVLHVPATVSTRPRALVIALHGMYLPWQNMADTSGLSAYGDAHGFLVGYGVGPAGVWNVGDGCCVGSRGGTLLDDVGYLTRVVDDVAGRLRVDRARVYLIGFSLGDMLALYAQCERPGVFAASGGSSGALVSPCRTGAPVRYLHLHGRYDQTVPYGGGRSEALRRDVPAAPSLAGLLLGADRHALVQTRTLDCAHAWATRASPCHVDATDLLWRWMSRFTREKGR
jgi:polyhydroxybutyrate depolymerase